MACPSPTLGIAARLNGNPLELRSVSMQRGEINLSAFGLPLSVSPYRSRLTLTQKERRWIVPSDRFVEYGSEDAAWARYFGFGGEREVDVHRTFDGVIKSVSVPEPVGALLKTELVFESLSGVETIEELRGRR